MDTHLVGSSLSDMLEGKELALSGGLALPPAASGEPRALCTQTSDPILRLPIPKASVRAIPAPGEQVKGGASEPGQGDPARV